MEGKAEIRDMLGARLEDVQPCDWTVDDSEPAGYTDGIIEGFIKFDTAHTHGYGNIRLRDGLIWTLLTTAHQLKGYEEPTGYSRPLGAKHEAHQGEPTWAEEREAELAELGVTNQPYVLIIGGVNRPEAARHGAMDAQTLRDWVITSKGRTG